MFVEKISLCTLFYQDSFPRRGRVQNKGTQVCCVLKIIHVFLKKYKFRRIYFYIKFNTIKLDNILWTNSVSYNKFYCKKQRKKKGVSIILFH